MYQKADIINNIADLLLLGNNSEALQTLQNSYPHIPFDIEKRTYTISQKMEQFCKDGFIDRYTGEKLLNPGILKVLSNYFPQDFPYHPHWKMTVTHIAYWDLTPTVDHIYPIAKGGADSPENWATTSMKNNSIKSNWSLEDIHWSLHPSGNIADWDGSSKLFIQIVEKNTSLLNDSYIKTWYKVSQKFFT